MQQAPLADGTLLERVVANLVGNVLRHTDSPVTVTVSALGDRVEIRVTAPIGRKIASR